MTKDEHIARLEADLAHEREQREHTYQRMRFWKRRYELSQDLLAATVDMSLMAINAPEPRP